jgi:hypothetical protein
VEAFFAGVAEMRAYLDRNIQDPRRRQQRLARLAEALLKPRGARALGDWLVRQLRDAVGAESVGLWVGDGLWSVAGCTPAPEVPAHAVTFTLSGARGPMGAVRLEGAPALDAASLRLVEALCDTAAMAIEHALGVEAIGRDPATGLLADADFAARAGAWLGQMPPPGAAAALLAFRVTTPDGLGRLAAAVRAHLPQGTPAARRGADVYAALSALPLERAERQATSMAQKVRRTLAAGTPPLRCLAVQHVTARPVDDLEAVMRRLAAALSEEGAP